MPSAARDSFSVNPKIYINFEKSRLIKSLVTLSAIIIAFYCSLIFLDFLFNFKWDAENIVIKNPEKFGAVLIGCMSPIAALLQKPDVLTTSYQ